MRSSVDPRDAMASVAPSNSSVSPYTASVAPSNSSVEPTESARQYAPVYAEVSTHEKEVLKRILSTAERYGGHLTGSWARGEATPDSDIDIYIPEALWSTFSAHILKVDEVVWQEDVENSWLTTLSFGFQLDFSFKFWRQTMPLPQHVTLEGVEFPTW